MHVIVRVRVRVHSALSCTVRTRYMYSITYMYSFVLHGQLLSIVGDKDSETALYSHIYMYGGDYSV